MTEHAIPSTPSIHAIIGAGQVGTILARHLAAAGHDVRLVRRGPPGAAIPGVTWIRGDVLDPAVADAACRGAVAVYNCTNPPDYARWDGVIQPLYRAIWAAAARAGARLVQLDNLYMIGRPERCPFDESTPERPCSAKGELRRALGEELLEMHRRGEIEAVIGRASDYFGPHTPSAAVFRPDVLARIQAGGSAYVFGDPDMPHGYTYTPDVARGLAILGVDPRAPGRVWHLPTAAKMTTRELIARFAAVAGTEVKVRAVPGWVLRALGLVSSLMAAIGEMNYQFEIPYVLDDGDFCRTFGVAPTPLDEAIAATLAAGAQAPAAA
ncbi:MAG: NAD-dependent epimerase/dehydratase family protein [Myxococcales bacterium]|nr:NAD-dependent epimerase/dehydratase family protein [Myxococcales bacterium]MCB9706769.1 NAD-dependent epimerase/dehydratase family protein [Myxococcales bacterium]